MKVTIWHNPQCSKSRQALELLESMDLKLSVRNYLKDAPSEEEIRSVLRKLPSKDPHDLARRREKLYAELGVEGMSGEDVIAAMAEHSKLIERPVVIAGRKARIGRPTDAILEILEAGPPKKKGATKSGQSKASPKQKKRKKNESAYSDTFVAQYDAVIAAVDGAERKGKANPYTSRNGNMFSFLTEKGLALRLGKADRDKHVAKHKTKPVVSYGAVMKEYVLVPEKLLFNTRSARALFRKSWDYAGTLKPKPTKK